MHIILVTKKKFNHMFQLGAGAEICPEPEPEKSKMTGSGNPAFLWSSFFLLYFTLGCPVTLQYFQTFVLVKLM